MAHYCPGPQTQQHSTGTAAFCPCTAGNSSGRKGRAVTAQRKLPQSSQGLTSAEQPTRGWAPAAQLQTGRWLPGWPPSLRAESRRCLGAGACSKQGNAEPKRGGSTLQRQTCLPPDPSSSTSSSLQPVSPRSCCREQGRAVAAGGTAAP